MYTGKYQGIMNQVIRDEHEKRSNAINALYGDCAGNIRAHYLTALRRQQYATGKISRLEADELTIAAINRATARNIARAEKKLEAIESAAPLSSLQITVDWNRNSNPDAHMSVLLTDHKYESYGATATGWGYCKLSTVIADMLNNCNAVRKQLCDAKEAALQVNPYASNNNVFTYGVYGAIPGFTGGVGVNTIANACAAAGINLRHTVDVKHFDQFDADINN